MDTDSARICHCEPPVSAQPILLTDHDPHRLKSMPTLTPAPAERERGNNPLAPSGRGVRATGQTNESRFMERRVYDEAISHSKVR